MSLKDYSREEIEDMALIELAKVILLEQKQAMDFYELYDKVAEAKGLTEEEKEDRMTLFYTELNMDGNFKSLGSNKWILKRYYRGEKTSDAS